MSVADEIKARLDIVQYISRTVPLKRAGRTYKACCPFHSERTPSFVVDPARQSWRCFGACSTGGDVFAFAMRQNGWTFAEALQELGKLTGVEVKPRSPEQQARDAHHDKLRGLLKAAAEYYHERLFDGHDPAAQRTLEYARHKRGLTDETLRMFGIGYAPEGWQTLLTAFAELGYGEDELIETGLAVRNETGRVYDRFRNRLMIPIRDERGRPVGFGARALAAEDNPKYLNSPQSSVFDKSRLLFALDQAGASIRQTETVVIVEGYLDVIQAHQAGYTNVVAQMGTALTETQLKLVAPRWAKRIILALDSDAAGQSATRRSLDVARETLQADYGGRLSVDMRILTVPDAKDPDDLIRDHPERWQALVDEASPIADYVIAMETAGLSPKASLQEREAVARRLLPLLNASENDLYRKDNVQKLALRLRIAERDLLAWASEQSLLAQLKAPVVKPVVDEPADPFGDSLLLPEGDALVPAKKAEEPASFTGDSALERDCLRLLLKQPELLYSINRKFRELAKGDERLLNGPLNDLCLDDFIRAEYRALATLLGEALDQDELEPIEYMHQRVDDSLRPLFDAILLGDLDLLRPRLRHGLSADLEHVMKSAGRSRMITDPSADAVHKALRLRRQRLQRERQDALFLQLDEQDKENAIDEHLRSYIILSAWAQRLIDAALGEQSRTLLA